MDKLETECIAYFTRQRIRRDKLERLVLKMEEAANDRKTDERMKARLLAKMVEVHETIVFITTELNEG